MGKFVHVAMVARERVLAGISIGAAVSDGIHKAHGSVVGGGAGSERELLERAVVVHCDTVEALRDIAGGMVTDGNPVAAFAQLQALIAKLEGKL